MRFMNQMLGTGLLLTTLNVSCQQVQERRYSVPQGHRGWLLIRFKGKGPSVTKVEDYVFDATGQCVSPYPISAGEFASTAWAFDGDWSHPIPSSDYPDKNAMGSEQILVLGGSTSSIRTTGKYKGECWTTYFVGTANEYLKALKENSLHRFTQSLEPGYVTSSVSLEIVTDTKKKKTEPMKPSEKAPSAK
jgi:hypothetical protein